MDTEQRINAEILGEGIIAAIISEVVMQEVVDTMPDDQKPVAKAFGRLVTAGIVNRMTLHLKKAAQRKEAMMKSKADRYRRAGRIQIIGGALVALGTVAFISTVVLAVLVAMGAGALIYGGINDLREAKEMEKGARRK